MRIRPFSLALLLCASLPAARAEELPAAARTAIAVEALSRLKGIDLEANPAVKQAVLKVLAATKGTAAFVDLVREFNIPGENQALLDFALAHPGDPAAPEAVRLVLNSSDPALLKQALDSTIAPRAATATELLAKLSESKSVPWLETIALDSQRPLAQRRPAIVGLARTRAGAEFLLDLAQKSKLPPEIKMTARDELHRAHWSAIRKEAVQWLPYPASRTAQPLPPVSALLKMKGDPTRGREVFFRQTSLCSTCHRINGQGADFGPNLSEIGTKLGKDALYEAIFEPSAGISFGYEAWQIETKSGDEGYGLLSSETADDIAIKSQSGVITHFKKSEIVRRTKLKTSIMPEGLQQTMSAQDLADLVEFLSSLKKSSLAHAEPKRAVQ